MNELAAALHAIRSAWDVATRDGGPACGMDVVEQAYTEMQRAWYDELGIHIAVFGHADGQ